MSAITGPRTRTEAWKAATSTDGEARLRLRDRQVHAAAQTNLLKDRAREPDWFTMPYWWEWRGIG